MGSIVTTQHVGIGGANRPPPFGEYSMGPHVLPPALGPGLFQGPEERIEHPLGITGREFRDQLVADRFSAGGRHEGVFDTAEALAGLVDEAAAVSLLQPRLNVSG